MTTSEDSVVLTKIKSTPSTKNNCDEQLERSNYLPSQINNSDLPKKKSSVSSISQNLFPDQQKDRKHLPVDENYFKIVIQDNGIGSEKECTDCISQLFQRLHGKSEYPGSGIALAICKKKRNIIGVLFGQNWRNPYHYLPERQISKHA